MAEPQREHDARDDEEESRHERVNRELLELLNELRVALPGVQVLFAFLLAVPFTTGWDRTTQFQRAVFYVTLLATAVSTAFFIAPTAYHRLHFRNKEKERILFSANAFAIVATGFLAVSMVGVVLLITDFIYSATAAWVAAGAAALVFGGLWFLLPLIRRWQA